MFAGPGSRWSRGRHGYSAVYFDTAGNIIGGDNAGPQLGNAADDLTAQDTRPRSGDNIVLGTNAGKRLNHLDRRNIMIGRNTGALNVFGGYGHNTVIGDDAGYNINAPTVLVNYGSCIAVGRAAGCGWTSDNYCISIGHASMFLGGGNSGVTAIGDGAGGADPAGSAAWQGSGLTYFGAVNDLNCGYLGRWSGKSSAAIRTNSHALGHLARLPAKDNVMVLGHGMTAVETAGRVWDGWTRVDITGTVGLTVTAAQLLAGIVVRAGALAGNVNDTTDTAANIVSGGPGANCEVPCSLEMSYGNVTGGGFTTTIVGGTGVAVSGLGLGGAVATTILAKFRLLITNSTPGAEAVTIYRVG